MNWTFLQSTTRAISRWWQRRRSVAQLDIMPDYLLADIGIERHEIYAVVNGLTEKQGIESGVRRTAKVRAAVNAELALSST